MVTFGGGKITTRHQKFQMIIRPRLRIVRFDIGYFYIQRRDPNGP